MAGMTVLPGAPCGIRRAVALRRLSGCELVCTGICGLDCPFSKGEAILLQVSKRWPMTPDVNVLVAASRSDRPHHAVARTWLEEALGAAESGAAATITCA